MMRPDAKVQKVYLYPKPVDSRRSINGLINKLYGIERDLKQASDSERFDARQQRSQLAVEQLKACAASCRRQARAQTDPSLPRSRVMSGGIVSQRREGTPQGGPLSPLLSNILLDGLDKELERRGHRFVRYADDANIYVRSPRAGERTMDSVERFLNQRLRLTLNREKSRAAGSWKCDYLGYGMNWHRQPRFRVATLSLPRLRDRIKYLLRGARGRKMAYVIERINPVLRGWAGYFKLAQGKRALETVDGWVRHTLRCVLWRQWKRPSTRARNLIRLGLDETRAWKSTVNGRGPWWNSGAAHMNQTLPKKRWDGLGPVSILDTVNRLSRIS